MPTAAGCRPWRRNTRPPFSSATMPPRSRPGQGRGPWIEAHAPRRFHPIDRGGVSPSPYERSIAMTTPTAGAALGNQLRAGTVAKVGSTKRIQELNGMLHANRPNVDITRARAYTKVYRATEGMPSLMRRYKASAEVYRTLTDNVYDYEQLVGWPTKRIRGPTSPLSSTPTGWPMTCPTSGTGPTTPSRSPTRTTRNWRRTSCPTGRTRPWPSNGATT